MDAWSSELWFFFFDFIEIKADFAILYASECFGFEL
jgi:hypothetical protein